MKRKKISALEILASCLTLVLMAAYVARAQPFNFKVIAGEWERYDGSYTLRVQNARSDGSVDVRYFNPGEIHVAESRVTTQGGRVGLFVKLQDEGYPGSTYTLYYYAEEDVLAGFYYQAALDQTYDVIFIRKGDAP